MSYGVGYCRPPVQGRFQKGKSGNPGGKPGARRAMEKRILVFLEAGVRARPEDLVASRPRTVLELMAKQLLCRAAQADITAIKFVLSFWRRPGNGVRRRRLSAGVKRTLIYGHAEETRMVLLANQAGGGVCQGDSMQTPEGGPLPPPARSSTPPSPQAAPRAQGGEHLGQERRGGAVECDDSRRAADRARGASHARARIPGSLENDARTKPDSQGIIEKVTCANWPVVTTIPCKEGCRARAGPQGECVTAAAGRAAKISGLFVRLTQITSVMPLMGSGRAV